MGGRKGRETERRKKNEGQSGREEEMVKLNGFSVS